MIAVYSPLGTSSTRVKLVVSKEQPHPLRHLFMSAPLQMVYSTHHTLGQETSVDLGLCAIKIPALIQLNFYRNMIGRVKDIDSIF